QDLVVALDGLFRLSICHVRMEPPQIQHGFLQILCAWLRRRFDVHGKALQIRRGNFGEGNAVTLARHRCQFQFALEQVFVHGFRHAALHSDGELTVNYPKMKSRIAAAPVASNETPGTTVPTAERPAVTPLAILRPTLALGSLRSLKNCAPSATAMP